LLEIPESIFWESDVAFLEKVVENKAAYDSWKNAEINRERERARKKAKQHHHRR
jgi:hypothetical protein